MFYTFITAGKIKTDKIKFSRHSSIFYFFYFCFSATSNGTKSSLKKKVGSKASMGVQIKICSENTLCEARNRVNCKLQL